MEGSREALHTSRIMLYSEGAGLLSALGLWWREAAETVKKMRREMRAEERRAAIEIKMNLNF